MNSAYYNDSDSYVAQWLGNLVAAGHLPQGTVDARSIVEIDPDELRSFRQCHFFAGIGGWPYALGLADWPDDREVWTASCPCQPLSSAGQRKGHADQRHLWPALYRLIAECRPATIFGEQVASKDGREWLAGIRADLESLGYAVGCADLCAAGVAAPHIRQRLFWVADASGEWRGERRELAPSQGNGIREISGGRPWIGFVGSDCATGRLAEPTVEGWREQPGRQERGPGRGGRRVKAPTLPLRPHVRARTRGAQLGEQVDRPRAPRNAGFPPMILPINRSLVGASGRAVGCRSRSRRLTRADRRFQRVLHRNSGPICAAGWAANPPASRSTEPRT
jgi:DNA (cytosine-5)-methyltransferase 1